MRFPYSVDSQTAIVLFYAGTSGVLGLIGTLLVSVYHLACVSRWESPKVKLWTMMSVSGFLVQRVLIDASAVMVGARAGGTGGGLVGTWE
jgi:hypothetical protein